MEAKWVKTSRGYQSPSTSFLLYDEWLQAGFQPSDLSFIDSSFYGRSMPLLKIVLPYVGVVVKFGEGCEAVAKHLQLHSDFEVIIRLYKYLSRFQWAPTDKDSVKIWIPHSGHGDGGEWKDPEMCVVHDDDLFNHKLHVLEKIYEASLLPFFSINLGVPVSPRVEEFYCNVWLDLCSANNHVTEAECCSAWKDILKHWLLSPSKVEAFMRAKELKFPTRNNRQDPLKLNSAAHVVVPDDLKLTALFRGAHAENVFAWYPSPSNNEIPVLSLFSLYNSLGVQNISEVVRKKEASVSNNSLRKLKNGEGILNSGLYVVILAYLSYPSFNISSAERYAIVKTLSEASAWEISKPMTFSYIMTLRTENGDPEDIVATAPSFFRWEKQKKRILIHPSRRDNQKMRLALAIEFAEVVSKGLLSQHHSGLVAGLCDMLKMGCLFEFDDGIIEEMLRHKNMQILEEDVDFLFSQVIPCQIL